MVKMTDVSEEFASSFFRVKDCVVNMDNHGTQNVLIFNNDLYGH
jgi:hypothetical protein